MSLENLREKAASSIENLIGFAARVVTLYMRAGDIVIGGEHAIKGVNPYVERVRSQVGEAEVLNE